MSEGITKSPSTGLHVKSPMDSEDFTKSVWQGMLKMSTLHLWQYRHGKIVLGIKGKLVTILFSMLVTCSEDILIIPELQTQKNSRVQFELYVK
jgi:hypothetical protein